MWDASGRIGSGVLRTRSDELDRWKGRIFERVETAEDGTCGSEWDKA